MIISLRPKSLPRFLFPSSNSPAFLKWIATTTPIIHLQHASLPEDQLRLFFDGLRDRKPISDYELALVSALKSCSSLLAVFQGRQIHCLVLKSGLDLNIFVQNSLINMYAKCGFIVDAQSMFDSCSVLDSVSCNIMLACYVKFGRLNDAYRLFAKTPSKGCVAYTTMIMGLAQSNFWIEAIELFKGMRYAGLTPNEVTIASAISAYSHLGGVMEGRMLHAEATKFGIEEFNPVSTNLVNIYCICSSLVDARILFDSMHEKNVVSWNVMLNGYSKAGLVDLARGLFERIPMRDVVSWGTMIDGYVRVERLTEALAMYRAMLCTGLGPNEVMIVDLISACGRSIAIREGEQFHGIIIKTGFDSYDFIQSTIIHFYAACHKINLACLQFELGRKDHLPSWNALITGFIRNGMIDMARQMFNEMPERDVFSWSALISGYAQCEQPDKTLELFHGMVASGVLPNQVTMVSVLSAIATSGSLKEGVWAHEYIQNNSIPINDLLAAALIDMYAKCGSINKALDLFYQIRENVSSVSPWNAIICGLAVHGHADLSLQIFSNLQRLPIKLNSITFIGVLSACCHAGLVELGEQYFRSMKSLHDIDPNIKHYGCILDLLGRAGRLQEAEEMIKSMPMKADIVIWGTLLAACQKHGNVEIGERAAENLTRLDTSHGASRVLLSNIYADAGRWEDAFLIRRAMQSQKLQKSPGCSEVV